MLLNNTEPAKYLLFQW